MKPRRTYRIGKIAKEYLTSKAHSSSAYCHILAHYVDTWLKFWGDRYDIRKMEPEDVEAYLARPRKKQDISPTTINNERNYLSTFFKWCIRRRIVPWNPVEAVDKRREMRRAPRVLNNEERQRLLAAAFEAGPAVHLFVVIALETGLRRNVISHLRTDMIQSGWRLCVPADLMKSREEFCVPLSPTLQHILASAEIWSPQSRKLICGPLRASDWQKITDAAKLPGVRVHDLRRTFLTRMRRAGVPLEVAMRLSDHRDLKTVLSAYRAIDDDELTKALESI